MGIVLGIETSCDETAAGIVVNGEEMLSNVILSQTELHAEYGGIVPELASRRHVEALLPTVQEALREGDCELNGIDAVAVTRGPGLVGSLLVGLSMAKGLAMAQEIPLVGINHLWGHVYANKLGGVDSLQGSLCLVVSGGHTDLVYLPSDDRWEVMGSTRDDAAGEAFDKVARLLGLGYPGGPEIARLAAEGDPKAVDFPRAYVEGSWDFSFSGLKTAVARFWREHEGRVKVEDVAASFQRAVTDVLVDKTVEAAEEVSAGRVILAGGVAANEELRRRLRLASDERGIEFSVPPLELCTDNGAMIAAAASPLLKRGIEDGLDLDVQSGLHWERTTWGRA